jgi:hypothetical protein
VAFVDTFMRDLRLRLSIPSDFEGSPSHRKARLRSSRLCEVQLSWRVIARWSSKELAVGRFLLVFFMVYTVPYWQQMSRTK